MQSAKCSAFSGPTIILKRETGGNVPRPSTAIFIFTGSELSRTAFGTSDQRGRTSRSTHVPTEMLSK
jgi:hypothetical protein